ncbi:hypothetical protein KP509_1Z257700 [Ceratopteris richardii]|nr:hypothetical protein KP509_1Z257700 [Ceratopteris richardii]
MHSKTHRVSHISLSYCPLACRKKEIDRARAMAREQLAALLLCVLFASLIVLSSCDSKHEASTESSKAEPAESNDGDGGYGYGYGGYGHGHGHGGYGHGGYGHGGYGHGHGGYGDGGYGHGGYGHGH